VQGSMQGKGFGYTGLANGLKTMAVKEGVGALYAGFPVGER
jgi:hypothetical protein